jgi:hypothetical protein
MMTEAVTELDIRLRQQRYRQLLQQPDELRQLAQASSLADFCAVLAAALQWPALSVETMLAFLQQQNQQYLQPELVLFSQLWQPAHYRSKDQSISWLPAWHRLSQPFYLDDLQLAGQSLLAQLIKPVSRLVDLLPQRQLLPAITPDLLIFHWSRCGSTLLSGSLGLAAEVKVLSESMLISDMLLDPYWPAATHPELLVLLIRLQGQCRHGETKLVVKCNAWDLQDWPLWLQTFPAATVLCLGREPGRILASHQRVAGRQMVYLQPSVWRDSTLLNPALPLLLGRIQVMQRLIEHSATLLATGRGLWLDYSQLIQLNPERIAALLGLRLDPQQQARWQAFWQTDAKQSVATQSEPRPQFQPSVQTAAEVFTAAELLLIQQQLAAPYLALQAFASAGKTDAMTAAC